MRQTSAEATSAPPATMERLIRFETPDEFRERPGFQPSLPPGQRSSFRIIGGYEFKKANWLRCGFSECRTMHGGGYVIRSAEGLETNIGNRCGKTVFGADWRVMREQFENQRKLEAMQDVLTRVIAAREATLKQAQVAHSRLASAAAAVKRVLALVEDYGPVKRAFADCLKQRGSLAYYRELTGDERAMYRGQRTVRETKGQIQGWHAATVNASALEVHLKYRVIVPLTEMDPQALRAMKQKQLEERLRECAQMAALVQQAEMYAEDAAKLALPANWHKFEMFCDASKVHMEHQGYKALRTLAGTL